MYDNWLTDVFQTHLWIRKYCILSKKSVKIHSKSVNLSGSETSHSHSHSHHVQHQIRDLISADELMQVKREKCVIVMEGVHRVLASKI